MQCSGIAAKTRTVYTLIESGQYKEAANLLSQQLNVDHNNRAVLSLLGHCCLHLGNITGAIHCYTLLASCCPHVERYRLYLALCRYKAHMYDDAAESCNRLTPTELSNDTYKLMAAIKYDLDDLPSAKVFLSRCPADDKDNDDNWGCIRFKEQDFEAALQHFLTARKCEGPTLDLTYNLAVCYYKLKQYVVAMRYVEQINERNTNELFGPNAREADKEAEAENARKTWTQHRHTLAEALNLKAAIALKLKNNANAAEAIANVPPRSEMELDMITLHNEALVRMADEPAEGIAKLQFLCGQNRFPPEVIPDLEKRISILQLQDVARDVMAGPTELVPSCLSQYEYDFIAAIVMHPQSPEESLRKIEALVQQQGDVLWRLAKQLKAAEHANDEDRSKTAEAYNEALQTYLSVLMEQAKIYWDKRSYKKVEKIFQQSVDFCGDYDTWKTNVGHTLFMQQTKYKEAAGFYETLVRKNFEKILDSSAIVLANLCVCYILMNQNEAAEELLRKVEKEEDKLLLAEPGQRPFHLCVINLVIGTLYCSKGNYEFGISRLIKAMQPYRKKLHALTWHYVKRCFLSMIENLAKHVITLKDPILNDCILFLEECSELGKLESSKLESPFSEAEVLDGKATVAYESRQLLVLMKHLVEL